MQTYVVISSQSHHPELDAAVQAAYAEDCCSVARNVWFVADRGLTAAEVSRKIGVRDGDVPGLSSVVVLQFGGYYGHANPAFWVWIAERRALL